MEQHKGSKRRNRVVLHSTLMILSIAYLNSCRSSNIFLKQRSEELKHHFEILDSALERTSEDTIHCCPASIIFMEKKTGISASSEGTTFGKFFFTREDLEKWHEWDSNKKKKNR